MPIVRRIPKRGFNNKNFGNVWAFVNLHDLNSFADGAVVTPEECLRSGLIPKIRSGLKVLGVGTLEVSLGVFRDTDAMTSVSVKRTKATYKGAAGLKKLTLDTATGVFSMVVETAEDVRPGGTVEVSLRLGESGFFGSARFVPKESGTSLTY